jgi:uncharacterized protein YlzI (FlbEa/FlbD family)
MSKLIIVHEYPKGREMVLNSDQFEYARVRETPNTRTEVRMMNGELHYLQESLDILIGLSQSR